MDKTKIIDKYKKEKDHIKRAVLKDGGIVIGMEVDENNFLHYVIKRGNNITIEEAQHTKLAETILITKVEKVTRGPS